MNPWGSFNHLPNHVTKSSRMGSLGKILVVKVVGSLLCIKTSGNPYSYRNLVPSSSNVPYQIKVTNLKKSRPHSNGSPLELCSYPVLPEAL